MRLRATFSKKRKPHLPHAYLSGHQLVQQRLEQLIQNGPLAPMQINLTINCVEDGDDLALFIHSRYSDTQLT